MSSESYQDIIGNSGYLVLVESNPFDYSDYIKFFENKLQARRKRLTGVLSIWRVEGLSPDKGCTSLLLRLLNSLKQDLYEKFGSDSDYCFNYSLLYVSGSFTSEGFLDPGDLRIHQHPA
ncbi:hypothetical protein KCM76_04260 [Zooshikella marina]|uniref:Uncharacterized protein n=1 Tax=Zooshikella ganghwensis TaxID=202772 RepID=A0A4P9VQF5_9GAMM|nr:hypothetical protein [Zooshikella ganghwensis]MBU2705178.1 hypothetical protein [Zooshikella ganghwensis]RDH44312.1 hypothetical protein B9G39_13135 [Zooshikella ganghwensis]